jgi:site-specific DNA-methyltransferase (adenine-specific)/modification methylase
MLEKVTIGSATLYHADCREVLPTLPVHDLMLTDPPYGIGINKSHRLATSRGHGGESWDDKPVPQWLMLLMAEQAKHLIVWGGNYYTMGPARCFLIWDKQNDGRDFADCELAWTNIDAVARIFRKRPMNMDGGKEHPTQKPIDLMTWCIDKVAHAQTVCDPFMGSGSTGVACAMLGRAFTGVERERRYFDIACERISRAHAHGQLLPPEPPALPEQQGMAFEP